MLNNKQSRSCSVPVLHSNLDETSFKTRSPANEKSFEIINVGKDLHEFGFGRSALKIRL